MKPIFKVPLLTAIHVFVGIILHPHGGVRGAPSLLGAGSRASLAVEGWILAFGEQVLDVHSSHIP